MALPVGAIVRGRETYFLRPDMTVQDAVTYMAEKEVGAMVVLEGERVAGIFTERDLMKRVVLPGRDAHVTRVSEVMTPELVLCEADESEDVCHNRMIRHRIRHLPVVEKGQLLGLVSLRDLLLVNLSHKQEELDQINAYIHFVPPQVEQRKS